MKNTHKHQLAISRAKLNTEANKEVRMQTRSDIKKKQYIYMILQKGEVAAVNGNLRDSFRTTRKTAD